MAARLIGGMALYANATEPQEFGKLKFGETKFGVYLWMRLCPRDTLQRETH